MHDNASAHKAKIIKKFLNNHYIPMLNWPACSPDLNFIENIWNLLKNQLQAHNPHLQQIDEIKQAVVEEWNAIPLEKIQKYVDSMPGQIQEVISKAGGHTRW